MADRKKLVAGNWKMNGTAASLHEVRAMLVEAPKLAHVELAICPPAILAHAVGAILAGGPIALGGQDCHEQAHGAFTGDVSAEMWGEAGARYCIVGHSERRAGHGETDQVVAGKATSVIRAGMTPIICLGESLQQRDAGETIKVVVGQLAGSLPPAARDQSIVIAYEPIWAIGSGRTPTTAQVAEVHAALRAGLRSLLGPHQADAVRLLYGGSVKPENAPELMHVPDVDGALVGGASLKAIDFLAIARACV
jgi:triosephosphate isomerase